MSICCAGAVGLGYVYLLHYALGTSGYVYSLCCALGLEYVCLLCYAIGLDMSIGGAGPVGLGNVYLFN